MGALLARAWQQKQLQRVHSEKQLQLLGLALGVVLTGWGLLLLLLEVSRSVKRVVVAAF
jgi:hypothetical protein